MKTNQFGTPVDWRRRHRFLEWAKRQPIAGLVHERTHYCAGSLWKDAMLARLIKERTIEDERAAVAHANQHALLALELTED